MFGSKSTFINPIGAKDSKIENLTLGTKEIALKQHNCRIVVMPMFVVGVCQRLSLFVFCIPPLLSCPFHNPFTVLAVMMTTTTIPC